MREPYPSETKDRFMVRLPEGMRDQIAEAAKKANRTMNAEIVSRLAFSFDVKAEMFSNGFDIEHVPGSKEWDAAAQKTKPLPVRVEELEAMFAELFHRVT